MIPKYFKLLFVELRNLPREFATVWRSSGFGYIVVIVFTHSYIIAIFFDIWIFFFFKKKKEKEKKRKEGKKPKEASIPVSAFLRA